MERLVLWDIDQTLVTIVGFGRVVFAAALLASTGRELEQLPDMAGKTDHELVTSVLTLHGIPVDDDVVAAFHRELEPTAAGLSDRMLASGQILPGAAAAITALTRVPGVVQSVVTGNIAPIARQKLTLFGLAGPMDFEVGGYGWDGPARSTLVRLATERAEAKYGRVLPKDRVVVIGDTAFDVAGARANGVMAIGVASGRTTAAELAEAGAHVVLTSLEDTEAALAAITR